MTFDVIHPDPSGHFLVTDSGQPFFWLADTAWELFHHLKRAEAERYFAIRRQQGFNVILAVILAEQDGLHTPNAKLRRPPDRSFSASLAAGFWTLYRLRCAEASLPIGFCRSLRFHLRASFSLAILDAAARADQFSHAHMGRSHPAARGYPYGSFQELDVVTPLSGSHSGF